MKISKFVIAATVAAAGFSATANATIIVTAPATNVVADSYLGSGNGNGFQNSNTILKPNAAIASITFHGSSGVYSGSVPNISTSPYGGGNANYLAIQPNGSINILLSAPSLTFSFLWGTVDNYNIFTDSAGSISGAAVTAADPSVVLGTTNELVTLTFSHTVTMLTFSDSTSSAFEFDTASPVPEPASLALLGGAVLGLGVIRQQKRRA